MCPRGSKHPGRLAEVGVAVPDVVNDVGRHDDVERIVGGNGRLSALPCDEGVPSVRRRGPDRACAATGRSRRRGSRCLGQRGGVVARCHSRHQGRAFLERSRPLASSSLKDVGVDRAVAGILCRSLVVIKIGSKRSGSSMASSVVGGGADCRRHQRVATISFRLDRPR